MSTTKQLLQSVGSSASLAVAAVAQALDPKFPWDKATILRVSGNNPLVARALDSEAVLTHAPKASPVKASKAAKAVKPPKAKKVSAWLAAQLAVAEVLVERLVAYGSHKVRVNDGTEVPELFLATLGTPEVGPRGGVSVMATLTGKKGSVRSYELSGNQADRLFAGGNCGTTVGHVLHTA
jgi:hypothetical protein